MIFALTASEGNAFRTKHSAVVTCNELSFKIKISIVSMLRRRRDISDRVNTDGWMCYYIGDDKVHQRGVGFLVSPKLVRAVIKVQPISSRVIVLRVNAKPQPITIIQAFMPTTEANEEDVLGVYATLQRAVEELPKKKSSGGNTVIQAMKTIIDQIWKTGDWPSERTQSEITTLPKVTRDTRLL